MATKSADDLAYGERWDRDRFMMERERDRDRFQDSDAFYNRRPSERDLEISIHDKYQRRPSSRPPWEGDSPRERRFFDDEPRRSNRRVVIDTDFEREQHDFPPPPRPATMIRRQSSLDTFDRRPARFWEQGAEEYGPPARRGDYRPDPYEPIPLPRSRGLPPPRVYGERDDYDEIKIAEPDRFGNENYYRYPQVIREREISRSRRRNPSSSKAHSRSARSSSRASVSSSSSSSGDSGGTTVTVKSSKSVKTNKTSKSEYPKKGKTRIPLKLVSKRAIIDLGYPFVEEEKVIVVQKALGQDNIDDLLKLSEDYKKAENEVHAARSSAGDVVEERKEETFTVPPKAPSVHPSHHSAHHTVHHAPTVHHPVGQPLSTHEVREIHTRVRSPSPSSLSYTTRSSRSGRSYSTSTTSRTPYIVDAYPRDYSGEVGPLSLVSDRHRSEREIKYEIERLESERDVIRREKHRNHHHHRHRSHSHSHSHSSHDELIHAERLPSGELVVYEDRLEKVEEPRRGLRVEKDKKGRMSISVPKYR